MTVDFGECPATVPNVDLTVTAPKEGVSKNYPRSPAGWLASGGNRCNQF